MINLSGILYLNENELYLLAEGMKNKHGRMWLSKYLRVLGTKTIVDNGIDDTVIGIAERLGSDRMKIWRLKKLFDGEQKKD